jgi:hypothetical protein
MSNLLILTIILVRFIIFIMEIIDEGNNTNTRRYGRTHGTRSPQPKPNAFTKVSKHTYNKWIEARLFATAEATLPKSSLATIQNIYKAVAPLIDEDEKFFADYIRPAAQKEQLLVNILSNTTSPNFKLGLKAIYLFYNLEGYPAKSTKDWSTRVYNEEQYAIPYTKRFALFLFERYPVPPFIANVWMTFYMQKDCLSLISTTKNLDDLKTNPLLLLFFHLTDGKSLSRLQGTGLKLSFGRKVAKHFLEVKEAPSVIVAYWIAIAKTEGMDDQFARQFAYYRLDINQIDFWRSFLQFVHRNQGHNSSIISMEMNSVVQKIQLIKFGAGPLMIPALKKYAKSNPNLSFKGRKWKTFQLYLKKVMDISYPVIPGVENHYLIDAKDGNWYKLERLMTEYELIEEGRAMGHCVGDSEYHFECLNGNDSIWSLKKLDQQNDKTERIATILLENNYLSEYAGPNNGEISSEIFEIINEWHTKTFPKKELVEA